MVPAQADPEAGSLCENEYFPVRAGAAWEYRTTVHQPDRDDSFIYERSEIVEVREQGFTLLPNISLSGEFRPPLNPEQSYIEWECLPEGLFQPGGGMQGITIAKTMETGSSWKTVQTADNVEIVYTVEGTEEVTVPAGTFEAVRVQVDNGRPGQNEFAWYAPGVGMVRRYFEVPDRDTWTLTELMEHTD